MTAPSWDSYVRFRTRAMHRLAELAGLHLLQEPGIVGALSRERGSRGALLLSAAVDRAGVEEVLREGTPQWVALLPPAAELAPLLAERGWDVQEERVTMAMDDLDQLAVPALPTGVELRQVAVRPGAEGYPLDEAMRLAFLYGEPETPAAIRDLEIEARLLRQLPGIRFFAAVAADGSCVGTAGSRVVDGAALVASVATHPSVRRQGIGTAMTAIALQAAAQAGATRAYLDATPLAVGIYRRLGFAEIGPIRWCERSTG